MTHKIWIQQNYADTVPIIGSYLLMVKGYFIYNTSSQLLDEILELVSRLLVQAMEAGCRCGRLATDCFVIATVDKEDASVSFKSVCSQCADTDCLSIEEFGQLVTEKERRFYD